MFKNSRSILIVSLFLVAVACGEPGDSSETTTVDESTTSTTQMVTTTTISEGTMPEVPTSNPNTAPETVLDRALLDLVSRTNVDPEDVTVVVAEAKTWADGSIGCPEPGMGYTQALVDGSRVLLEVDGRLYAYHAGSDGEPFLCESDEKDGGYDFVPPPGFNE